MRCVALCCAIVMVCAPAFQAEDGLSAAAEAQKWAAEDALDRTRLGQTDMGISAIGHIQLAVREWTAEEMQDVTAVDAGVFHATKLLRREGWVDRSAALRVRFANAAVLDWLRKHPSVKLIQVQGRLRVDGKYFLIEDCRPAEEKPVAAPAVGRSKRGGM